jgi:uncharacterized protein YraI
MTLTRLAAAAAMLAAITATMTTAAAAKPVTLGAETNLRKAPGTKSEVVTLIPKGESVEVGDCDAGWCKVTWNGQDGYAIARNLGPARAAQRRVARRYADDGYEPVGPPVGYEDGPYPIGPPAYYGYYPYPGAYWYGGGWGWRGGWHHHRRW